MGFIYQEANAYGVEALVALERHYTPTEEKYCTAVTEAVRICDTYGIPERELVPQVRHIAAAEEYLLEHLSEDEETLQFLFTPLSGSNTCLAWFLVWDYVRPGGEKAYKYTGHTPQQRLRDIISAVGQYQEDPLPPPQQLNTGDYTPIAVEVTCDHDHTTRTETPATCTEDGSVTVVCDDCDEVLSTETLPATGHSTVVKNAKDATCTEPGYTGDKVCTVCGETGETGEVIPAAGHSYKDGKCTVCGAADPNANSGGNTGNHGTDSPNTADGAAMGLWLSLMTVAVLAGAVLVAGKTPRA